MKHKIVEYHKIGKHTYSKTTYSSYAEYLLVSALAIVFMIALGVEFIKKFWWIILLLILAIYFIKQSSKKN